jgi:hypothetical protein
MKPTIPVVDGRRGMQKITHMPLEPLEELVESLLPVNETTGRVGDADFASLCGVSSRAIGRWRKAGEESDPPNSGLIPWITADIVATSLHMYAGDIWDEWIDMDRDVIEGSPKSRRAIDRAMKQISDVMNAEIAEAVLAAGGRVAQRNVSDFLECVASWERVERKRQAAAQKPPRRSAAVKTEEDVLQSA